MSDDEKFQFAGTLCLAARRLRIPLSKIGEDCYGFNDVMTGAFIPGVPNKDRKEALYSACEKLSEYFQWTRQN